MLYEYLLYLKKILFPMLLKIYGSAVFGVEAITITVEVNVDKDIGYHVGQTFALHIIAHDPARGIGNHKNS
ncbi:MAG: hypothetical protein ACI9AV_001180 [Sediminicola sp.]|jgi:hypothetical protein